MINLKLAEYDLKTGKFVRFLELGKEFTYGGDYIIIASVVNNRANLLGTFNLDKKDPLKRFNGSFNGITFGKGMFILIENYKDIITANVNYEDIIFYNIGRGYYSFTHNFFYKK